jgi:hypothetical protein
MDSATGGDRAPNPPEGYVVSFVRFHERGFNASASRFMRALCHYYDVECSLSCKIQHFSGYVLGVCHLLGFGPWALGFMFTSLLDLY